MAPIPPPPEGSIPLDEYMVQTGQGRTIPPPPPGTVPMTDDEIRLKFGTIGQNALAGIKDLPSSIMSMPDAIASTAKNSLSSVDNALTGEALAPEERQGLRNLGSMAGGLSGALAGGEAGALAGTAVLPGLGTAIGGLGGAALGGGLGLLGIDWLAEKLGVDAPRTSKERVNQLAYNVAQGAGSDLALRGVGMAAKNAIAPVRSLATDVGRTEAAANVLDKVYGENAVGKIQSGLDSIKGDPLRDYKTTAELLQSEPAAQLQKQLEMTDFGSPIGDKAIERTAARKEVIDNLAPKGASIEDVQAAISSEIDDLKYQSGGQDSALPRNIDPTVSGAGIRDIAEQLFGKAREGVSESFQSIPGAEVKRFTPSSKLMTATARMSELFGPGSEGAPSEIQRLVQTLNPEAKSAPAAGEPSLQNLAQALYNQNQKPQAAGSSKIPLLDSEATRLRSLLEPETSKNISDQAVQELYRKVTEQTKPVDPRLSLDYLQRLRRWAGEVATDRFGKGQNRAGSVAQGVVSDVDKLLEKAVQDKTMPEAQAKAYKNALAEHRDMVQTFEQGPMGRVLRRGQGASGYNIEPSSVGRQFWNSNPEAMSNFSRALGDSAQARELLIRDALTDFRASSKSINGETNVNGIKSWINDHEAFLSAFPEVKAGVQNIYQLEAKAALKNKTFKRFIEANPEQATQVLMQGVDSGKRATMIKRMAEQEPDILLGVRRGIIDKLHSELYSVGGSEKPTQLKEFLRRNKTFIGEIFKPEQVKALEAVYSDFQSSSGVEELASRASRGQAITAQKGELHQVLKQQILDELGGIAKILDKSEKAGTKTGAVIGAVKGYQMMGPLGGAAGTALGAMVGGKAGSVVSGIVKRAQTAVLGELAKAAADPQFAQLLLTKATPKNLSLAQKLIQPKLQPIRQLLISGYLASREDRNKNAEALANALGPNSFVASGKRQPQLQNLAEALSETQDPRVLQTPQPSTMTGDMANPQRSPSAPMAASPTPLVTTGDGTPIPTEVDKALVDAVAMQESSNRANAVGPQTKYGQAKGRMQLLDSTGKELHKQLGLEGEYNPFDAAQNTLLGETYLKQLKDRFGGSVPLALAAYNWGMGNLDKAIAKIGQTGPKKIQAFLEQQVIEEMRSGASEAEAKRQATAKLIETFGPSVLESYLPDETRQYVRKILNRYTSSVMRA